MMNWAVICEGYARGWGFSVPFKMHALKEDEIAREQLSWLQNGVLLIVRKKLCSTLSLGGDLRGETDSFLEANNLLKGATSVILVWLKYQSRFLRSHGSEGVTLSASASIRFLAFFACNYVPFWFLHLHFLWRNLLKRRRILNRASHCRRSAITAAGKVSILRGREKKTSRNGIIW